MKRHLVFLAVFAGLALLSTGQTLSGSLTYSVQQPTKKTARPPVLILLHGYGSHEEDLFELARTMDPRFMTFSLRAPNALPQGGFCWYALEFSEGQPARYDYGQAESSRKQILSFISRACKTYQLDSTQVFLLGFSQGAIMAYDLALSSPARVKGVVALSGRMMDESRQHKASPALLSRLRFFIGHGLSDNVIKPVEAEKASAFLKEKKVAEVTHKTYEMPHSLSGQELNDLRAWLTKAITPTGKQPAEGK